MDEHVEESEPAEGVQMYEEYATGEADQSASGRKNAGARKRRKTAAPTCLPARVCLFWHIEYRAFLCAYAFRWFPMIEPKLVPWRPGQNMYEVNKSVIGADHPLLGCIPDFTTPSFFTDEYVPRSS